MTCSEITEAIWASMPVPSVVYDNHERIVEINPAAEGFFNVSRRVMVGSFLWHRLILEEHLRENFSYALGNAARLFVNEVKVSTYQGTTCLCNLKLAPMSVQGELMLLMIVPHVLYSSVLSIALSRRRPNEIFFDLLTYNQKCKGSEAISFPVLFFDAPLSF